MARLSMFIALSLGLCLPSACSTYSNRFVDADGTTYESQLMVAPFSKLEGGDASMGYRWDAQSGQIGVGARVQSIDQTPQIDAMRIAIDAAVKAALAGAAGPAAAPAVLAPALIPPAH